MQRHKLGLLDGKRWGCWCLGQLKLQLRAMQTHSHRLIDRCHMKMSAQLSSLNQFTPQLFATEECAFVAVKTVGVVVGRKIRGGVEVNCQLHAKFGFPSKPLSPVN